MSRVEVAADMKCTGGEADERSRYHNQKGLVTYQGLMIN
jgi:hypothetical protein